MSALADLLGVRRLTEVVDVGANPIDGAPPYKPLLERNLCRVTGFEPQQSAFNDLQLRKGPNERYLPYAVGDGGTHTLNICVASGLTSLLEPDDANLSLFEMLRPLAEVIERVPLQTRKLDDMVEVDELDFLKIDIQGGELAVFQGGRAKLAKAVMIQTEVSFISLYENQATLGEVDIELRSQGFVPHCFAAVKHWPIAPCLVHHDPRRPIKQLLEADIVYVRDIARPDSLDDEQLKHIALIAHHCYESYDLSLRCIAILERRGVLEPGAQQRYLALMPGPGLSLWEGWKHP